MFFGNKVSILALACTVGLVAGLRAPQAWAKPIEDYVWDLDSQFPDAQSWARERDAVRAMLPAIHAWRDRPVQSASALSELLGLSSQIRGRAAKMAKFGLLQSEIDTESKIAAQQRDEGKDIEAEVERALTFLEPRILAAGATTLETWLSQDENLRRHERRIRRVLRLSPYAAARGTEERMQSFRNAAAQANTDYGALAKSDLNWPDSPDKLALPSLDIGAYASAVNLKQTDLRRESSVRLLRHLLPHQDKFAEILLRRIAADLSYARSRNLTNSIDSLLVLRDGMPPLSHQAVSKTARLANPVLQRVARSLKKLYAADTLVFRELYESYAPQANQTLPIALTIDRTLAALAPLGKDYADLAAARFELPWLHLPPSPNKSGTVGVFWQVGGGHPHTLLRYRGTYRNARTFAGAAVLMMGYASVPADRPPEKRDEDFPIFGNALWYLGPQLFDRVSLQSNIESAAKIEILTSQLASYVRNFVYPALAAEFESELSNRLAGGRSVKGADISTLYLKLLREYFEGAEITVPDYYAAEWMAEDSFFYGPDLASFASAMACALVLDEGVARQDRRIIEAVKDGIGRSKTHLSAEVLTEAGIDLASGQSLGAVIERMERTVNDLENVFGRR
jgi:oligoendopeptidase F